MDPHESGRPEDELRIAREALKQGDVKHTLHHVAMALADDPLRADALELLDRAVDGLLDPAALLPIEEHPVYFGIAALRARLLAGSGEVGEALRLLNGAVAASRKHEYLEWGLAWLQEPGAVETASAEMVAGFVGAWIERYPGIGPLDDPGPVARAISVAERFLAVHPGDAMMEFAGCALLRKSGRVTEAEAAALRYDAAAPSWRSATSVALTQAALGRTDEAIRWYRKALERDPSDLTARLDIGDLLLGDGRPEEAALAFEEVLEREPEHAWALPSHLYSRHRCDPAGPWRRQLLELAARTPNNRRASELAADAEERVVTPRGEPWVDFLPPPLDATTNMLRTMVKRYAAKPPDPGGRFRVTIDYLEAPSSLLAVDRQIARAGWGLTWDITVKWVQSPDPREALDPAAALWRYEDRRAIANVAPPEAAVARGVALLAASPYALSSWWDASRALASELGLSRLASLKGVMVHPPEAPEEIPLWDWIQRVQVAAAFTLAHLRSLLRGAAGRRALLAIAGGPMDWTVAAAVQALAQLAVEDERARAPVSSAFEGLLTRIPEQGYCCHAYALACCWQRLPGLDDHRVRQLERWRASLEQ